MSNPIVDRLAKNRSKNVDYLKESMLLYEAENDEEEDEEISDTEVEDTSEESTDDFPEPEEDTDTEGEEEITEPEDEFEDDSTAPTQGSLSDFSPDTEDPSDEDAEETTEEPENSEEADDSEENDFYENPLDNQYAVKFTLGDEIKLSAIGDTKSAKSGIIDGYDPEGFYRVKWGDGTITNGITDIALEELVAPKTHTDESKCICGSTDLIVEGTHLICDRCGRQIRENASLLPDDDESKGNKIRAEVHPMSTAKKPTIAVDESGKKKSMADLIREAMLSNTATTSAFDALKSLENEFWTRKDELVSDIEKLGYTVDEINDEYVIVSSEEDEENAYQIFIDGTSRTMTLNFKRARLI